MRNMLTGDNPARAGEDSYGKSKAIMIPPKGTGPLLKQRRDCGCIFAVGLSGMITIRCICTDKAQMRILRFSYLYYRRNPVASGEWFDSIPHFFVQKMHRLLSCLKYQGRVLQEEREDKKNEYDCFNG